MKLEYFVGFIFLSAIFFAGAVSADVSLRVSVQVNSGVSPYEPISGAGVVINDLTASSQVTRSTNASGRTSPYASIAQNHEISISVTKDGYATNTTTFNVGPFSDFPDKLFTIYLTPSAVAPAGPLFIVNEKFANTAEGGCGTGWNKTITFTDAYSGTYEHCVQYGSFSAGGTYVVDSYIRNISVYDDTAVCGSNVRSGAPFRTTDNQFAVLCVNRSVVRGYSGADGFTDRVMSNATAVLNTVCPIPLRERGNASVQNGLLRHCTYVFNTPPEAPAVSGCTIESVSWVDELNATPITQARGWANGNYADGDAVYPFVTLSAGCSGKTILFGIYKTYYESGKAVDIGPLPMDTMEHRTINGVQKLVSYTRWLPPWAVASGPGAVSGPIDYWFIATVNGEAVSSSLSPRLTVLKPLEKCTSDDNCTTALPFCDAETGKCIARECTANADCADGEICSDAGGCVSETSACTFSSIEWHKADTGNLVSGTLLAGGVDGKKCGDKIYLAAVGGNSACDNLHDGEIKFKIKENDLFSDDDAFVIDAFPLGDRFESDYWEVSLPSNLATSVANELSNRFELLLGSIQYYPVIEINGEEIEISNTPSQLRVKLEDIDCREDRDCAEGYSCDAECGFCVAGADDCRINSDCSSGQCKDGTCVDCVNDDGCGESEVCNSDNECVGCVNDGDCEGELVCNEENSTCVEKVTNCTITLAKWMNPVTESYADESEFYGLREGFSDNNSLGEVDLFVRAEGEEEGDCDGKKVMFTIKRKVDRAYLDSRPVSVEIAPADLFVDESATGDSYFAGSNWMNAEWLDEREDTKYIFLAWIEGSEDKKESDLLEVLKPVCKGGNSTYQCEDDFSCDRNGDCVEGKESSGSSSSAGGFDFSAILPIIAAVITPMCPQCGIIFSLASALFGGGGSGGLSSLGGLFGLVLQLI